MGGVCCCMLSFPCAGVGFLAECLRGCRVCQPLRRSMDDQKPKATTTTKTTRIFSALLGAGLVLSILTVLTCRGHCFDVEKNFDEGDWLDGMSLELGVVAGIVSGIGAGGWLAVRCKRLFAGGSPEDDRGSEEQNGQHVYVEVPTVASGDGPVAV